MVSLKCQLKKQKITGILFLPEKQNSLELQYILMEFHQLLQVFESLPFD